MDASSITNKFAQMGNAASVSSKNQDAANERIKEIFSHQRIKSGLIDYNFLRKNITKSKEIKKEPKLKEVIFKELKAFKTLSKNL
jgi:hypothetical protein